METCQETSDKVIDVRPLGPALTETHSGTLARTGGLEIVRLVIARGRAIPTHQSRGAITVHCLEGRISFTAEGFTRVLEAGRMLILAAGEPHSLVGLDDSSVLVTKVLPANPVAF